MRKLTILLILVMAASAPVSGTPEPEQKEKPSPAAPAAPNYNLDWYSINSGGAIDATSTSYRLGASVGQSVAGEAHGTNFSLGIGFWSAFAGALACLVTSTGDVDVSGSLTSADIIYMVNHVFKGGLAPLPCSAAGDVNCDGNLTSADIIYLVNFVFKGGPAPCNVCTLIPAQWSCP